MSLYINSATASSDLNDSRISQAITHLATTVAIEKEQEAIPEGPSLDVTFMLPGKLEKPDFSGMRMGGYSRESDTLFFERAIPEHIVHSEQAEQYVAIVMQDVVTHASSFFQENEIDFDGEQWQKLVDRLAESDTRWS